MTLQCGRTRWVGYGFADSSFTLADGQGDVTQAGVPISFLLGRFDVDILYPGEVDDDVAVDRPTPCTIPTSLDGRQQSVFVTEYNYPARMWAGIRAQGNKAAYCDTSCASRGSTTALEVLRTFPLNRRVCS